MRTAAPKRTIRPAHVAIYARWRARMETVLLGDRIRATPQSTAEHIFGEVVEVDGVTLALRTPDGEVVWVHGDDLLAP